MYRTALRLISVLALGALAACNGGAGTVLSPNPPPSPQHLYVANLNTSITVYSLPATAASVPIVTLPLVGVRTVAVDPSGRVFAALGSTVLAFTTPLSAASTPAFSLTFTHPVKDLAFNGAGVFAAEYSSATCCIESMANPLSGASTVAYSLPADYPYGVTFDPSGNLFGAGGSEQQKYAAPVSSASLPANFGTNADNFGIKSDASGRLFVANGTSDGKIDVYAAGTTTVAFTMNVSPTSHPIDYMAFDAVGNLYATCINDSAVYVLAPPFSSASTPLYKLSSTGAVGVAVGP